MGKVKKRLCMILLFTLAHIALAVLLVRSMPTQIIPEISESFNANVAITFMVVFVSLAMWTLSFLLVHLLCAKNHVDKDELRKYLLCVMWIWLLVGMLTSMWIYVVCYDDEISLVIGRNIYLLVTAIDYGMCSAAIEIWQRRS